jgi:hypothetical protein
MLDGNPLFGPQFNSLFGMKIIEVRDDIRPVLRVRNEIPMTDESRRDMNAWLLETFGTRDHSLVARGSVLMMAGGVALMRKEDAARLYAYTA